MNLFLSNLKQGSCQQDRHKKVSGNSSEGKKTEETLKDLFQRITQKNRDLGRNHHGFQKKAEFGVR